MRTIQVLNTLLILTSLKGTWLDNDILLIVYYGIKFLGRKTKKITYLVRQRTEVPDMSYWNNELDVTRTLTTNLLLSNLNTASVADNTLIANTLVLTAGALIVLCRTKDTLAEQAITLRFVGTVIDGFRLCNLTIRIFLYLLW